MEAIRSILHWKLLPLLVVGLANAGVWYKVFVPQGPTFVTIGAAVAVAIAAGMVTPNGLWWFSTICISLPPLMISNRHGALIFHLLFGFLFPPMWIYFLMNFTPVGVGCAGFVLVGCGIRKLIAPLPLATIEDRLIVPQWVRLTPFHLCLCGFVVFGNWIGFMSAIAPDDMFASPPGAIVPGRVIGTVVSRFWGRVPAGQYATAIGNGAVYGLFLYSVRWLSALHLGRHRE